MSQHNPATPVDELPPRVWIFVYHDEQGNEFIEADRKPFGKNEEDQYLSLTEARKESAALRESLEQVRIAIIENAEDTLWFNKYQTCVDFIDEALADSDGDK